MCRGEHRHGDGQDERGHTDTLRVGRTHTAVQRVLVFDEGRSEPSEACVEPPVLPAKLRQHLGKVVSGRSLRRLNGHLARLGCGILWAS